MRSGLRCTARRGMGGSTGSTANAECLRSLPWPTLRRARSGSVRAVQRSLHVAPPSNLVPVTARACSVGASRQRNPASPVRARRRRAVGVVHHTRDDRQKSVRGTVQFMCYIIRNIKPTIDRERRTAAHTHTHTQNLQRIIKPTIDRERRTAAHTHTPDPICRADDGTSERPECREQTDGSD